VIVGIVLRLVFSIVLLPFRLLGAIIGLGVAGLVFAVLAVVLALIIGTLTLVGAVVAGAPILLLAGIIWGLVRLLRRDKKATA
jgi:membrane-anchored protein YejM (alkaline phosphatase superfamily)